MIRIFDVGISVRPAWDIKDRIGGFLRSDKGHHIVTANPEMLVAARKDDELRKAMIDAHLVVPDGFGLVVMARLLYNIHIDRITGSDVIKMTLSQAPAGTKVFLLGGAGRDAEGAAKTLSERYPDLAFDSDHGGHVRKDDGWHMPEGILGSIKAFEPDILLVSLGHGKQEVWIRDHLQELPSVRVAIGVGGVFAFLSGRIRRAPEWMQGIGLEWFWRFLREPKRLLRILRAVFLFPILAYWDKIRGV